MKMLKFPLMEEINPIQASVLIALLFKPKARFRDLNTLGITTDHFNFHVKRLLKVGLIEKTEGLYQLSQKGKQFAGLIDTGKAVLEKQAKIGVIVCSMKKVKGVTKYLVQRRLKQPFYEYNGFVSGKIRWGETANKAAHRELSEETNLKGDLNLIGIEHKMDYSKDKILLDDKFFFIYKATSLKGRLNRDFKEGENVWLTGEEIIKLPRLFDDMRQILEMSKKKHLVFFENKFFVSGF